MSRKGIEKELSVSNRRISEEWPLFFAPNLTCLTSTLLEVSSPLKSTMSLISANKITVVSFPLSNSDKRITSKILQRFSRVPYR